MYKPGVMGDYSFFSSITNSRYIAIEYITVLNTMWKEESFKFFGENIPRDIASAGTIHAVYGGSTCCPVVLFIYSVHSLECIRGMSALALWPRCQICCTSVTVDIIFPLLLRQLFIYKPFMRKGNHLNNGNLVTFPNLYEQRNFNERWTWVSRTMF